MRFDPSVQPFNPKSGNLLQQTPWLKGKNLKERYMENSGVKQLNVKKTFEPKYEMQIMYYIHF